MFRTRLMFGIAATLTAGGALLMAAGPAVARDVTVIASVEDDVPVARVTFADLDLAKKAGQATLRQRVGGAIYYVCGATSAGMDPSLYAECRNSAWDQAKPQMAAAIERAERIALGTANAQDRALALNSAIRFGAR